MSAPTSDSAIAARRSLLMKALRPKTIRGRLARILLVSLILVFALMGDLIAGVVSRYLTTGQVLDSLVVQTKLTDLEGQGELERGLTNAVLAGDGRFQNLMMAQRSKMDAAAAAVDSSLSQYNIQQADAVRAALSHLSGLTGIREAVDTHRADRQEVLKFYKDALDNLQRINFTDQSTDSEIRTTQQARYVLGFAKEEIAYGRDVEIGIFVAGRSTPDDFRQLQYTLGSKTAVVAAMMVSGAHRYDPPFQAALQTPQAVAGVEAEHIATISPPPGPLAHPVDTMAYWTNMSAEVNALDKVQTAMLDDIRQRGESLQHDAAVSLTIYLATAVVMAAIEIWLMIGAMRSIIRPLSALAREADDVAQNRLPASVESWHAGEPGAEPVPPQPVRIPSLAGLEIASVAHALDRVQHTAWELASEQVQLRRNTTESLANLGRRHQNLLRRQLGLISEFEREELDPSALANLFELDHLATRMRRNAESLLVLVGETSRRKWSDPIPLTDVIRAGLSEVEGYRRVALRRLDEILIAGTAVSELAHILAELIENGLAFSPPDLEVEVYGRSAAGHYLLAVVDHGVGMSRDELAQANARLQGDADFLLSSSRFLGHYVVGRLARRLGIEVELTVSPVGGVVARLLLPADIVVDPKALPAPNGNGETGNSGAANAGNGITSNGNTSNGNSAVAPSDASATVVPVTASTNADEPVSMFVPAVPHRPLQSELVPSEPESVVVTLPGVQTTRNGLVKRPRRPSNAPRTGEQPVVRMGEAVPPGDRSEPTPQRSPEQIRTLLSSFRAGHQRGVNGAQVDEELR